MKRCRVQMLTVDDARGASTRYRVLAYRPRLEAAGFRTCVRYPLRGPRNAPFRHLWRALDLARDLVDPGGDLLFVHRKMYPPRLAARLGAGRRPLVLDMDDALDLPPPGKDADAVVVDRYRRNFEATANAATLVLCGNRELASRLPHDRFELLPTPIDTARFRPEALASAGRGKTLGWVGHSDNLAYLEGLGGPMRELTRRHPGLRLVVVADQPLRLPGIDVEFRRWSLGSELSCFEGIDIGLMPLADTPWARSKCSFKAVQYMALGIPAVISPVGMNAEVVQDGENGYLPRDDFEWVAALDRLLVDEALRARIGAAGRARIEAAYSLDVVSTRLVSLLERVAGASSHESAS